ncbi:uncharacterized protein TRUGW13939_02991 [Talaromyces rugulosus]|uniref:Uncharacterized protein n=1 Tax=Talaromyces rugulosus TaxID=121627 RepID=A0A7H8QPR4_TALRU|nr:uncharacterized protein TRUGW13939_02991 [Talaromyces rugulosus]QKX55892.1 hypothetical protein TRUGW13939_02991 [Talaromyces rugulosus]
MYVQNLFTLSVAALAGSAIAAEYNGGEIPAALRQGRGKNRASSSAAMSMMATPSSSSAAMSALPSSAMMMMVTVTVTPTVTESPSAWPSPSSEWPSTSPTAWPSAAPSPSASPSSSVAMQRSFTPKVSPSSSHLRSSSATHAAMASSTPLIGKIGVPVNDLVDNKDDKSKQPFQNKAGKDKPAPAAQIIGTDDMRVNTKDDCSLRCQSLAEQCVELLPKDNDFCWTQYPDCQNRCVTQHVGTA